MDNRTGNAIEAKGCSRHDFHQRSGYDRDNGVLLTALEYARHGWPVLPLVPGRKNPATSHGVKDATTLEAQIRNWFANHLDRGVGIACGEASGLLVIDVDPRNGGDHTFDELTTKLGALPDTVTQLTAGGGCHYLFRYPDAKGRGTLGPGVDVKSEGGYIVAHPSVINGRRYEWEASADPLDGAEVAELPEAWRDAILATSATERPPGARNDADEYIDPSTVTELRSALNFLDADEYGTWTSCGHRLKSLGNVGRELWLTWSQTSPRWEPDDARRWDTFEGSSTGYQSIFAEAQRLGWVNPRSREAQPITARSGPADHEQRQGQQPPPALWPDPVDVRELLSGTPMPPRMIIDDWLPCGYATLFAGHGGAGKSSTALHLAVCIATGREFFGLHCSMRRVMYLSCEDRADVLHWRLSRICAHDGVDPGDLAGFNLFDLVGADTILYRKELMTGAGVTGVYRELERRMTETRSEVLFVDGVSDAYGGSENDRGEVKQFVNSLVRLIGTSGAVVLIHHVNRQSAASGVTSEGYSGSTGWHNSVRARWYLYPETERTDEGITTTGDLVLALQKSNLGRDDQSLRLRWDDAAHMFLAEEAPSRFDVEDREEAEQEGIVRALREVVQSGDYVPAAQQGQRTAYHVLAATESLPESLKLPSARKRFWRHIEKLRRNRIVREGEMRRANRHVVATLELVSPKNGANVNASDSDKDIRRITAQDAPAPNAPYSAGGYRGCARAQSPCRRCDGEGCPHCAGGTS